MKKLILKKDVIARLSNNEANQLKEGAIIYVSLRGLCATHADHVYPMTLQQSVKNHVLSNVMGNSQN